jgi:hypothetical protein
MQWGMRISSRSSGDLAAHDGIEANAGNNNQRAKVESQVEGFMFLKKESGESNSVNGFQIVGKINGEDTEPLKKFDVLRVSDHGAKDS